MKRFALLLLLAIPALAQNPVVPYRSPRATFQTATGQPLSGGCIFTYQGGTTTPQATYTDSTGGTSNANPVILDSTGSAVMWLGVNSYKFVAYSTGGVHCASGSLQWTVDNVPGDAFLNGTISGATITNPTLSGGTIAGTAISGSTMAGSNVNSTDIGQTTPAKGMFTSLSSLMNSMSFSSTPIFNAGGYGFFAMSLTNNVTSSTITGGQSGQQITLDICQVAPGGHTFVWPTNLLNPPAVNQSATGCTIVQAIYNGGYWITTYSTSAILQGIYNTVAFSTTPIFSAGAYNYFALTLTAPVTSSSITGGVMGQIISLNICENSTGGYAFVWPPNLTNPPAISLAVNSCTATSAVFDGTNWNSGYGAPAQAHAIVFADLSNAVYGVSAVVNLFNTPVSGNIPVAGTGTYNGVTATSKCTLMTATTASTTFSLVDGSSTFGTVVFAASGVTGTINISTQFPVVSGDSITITAPATADTTAAGLNCSLVFAY
jgi:hypothetical protein